MFSYHHDHVDKAQVINSCPSHQKILDCNPITHEQYLFQNLKVLVFISETQHTHFVVVVIPEIEKFQLQL
jgi:hypothetical protein